jgi:hypothetical protein
MSTKSREYTYGTMIRVSAERAKEARKQADRLACEAWNFRMLGYKGPAQPSPTLGDALNAGYLYLEVRCLACDTHQTVALDVVRRSKTTPIHELERYMRCRDCSQVRGYAYKRSHLVAPEAPQDFRVTRRQRGGPERDDLTHVRCLEKSGSDRRPAKPTRLTQSGPRPSKEIPRSVL